TRRFCTSAGIENLRTRSLLLEGPPRRTMRLPRTRRGPWPIASWHSVNRTVEAEITGARARRLPGRSDGQKALSNMPAPDHDRAMVTLSRTVSIALSVGLAAAGFLYHSPARAQSADLVLCDRIAADPADPDRPADVKGVPEIATSDIATAIKFCKIASAGSRRAMDHLGPASAPHAHLPDAIAAWRKAADKGSSSAMVELGVLYATGSGVPKDDAQARKLFERAAAAGNPRGVTNLASISGSSGVPSDPAQARASLSMAAQA